MQSKYFSFVTETQSFRDNFAKIKELLKDKKVLIYGAGDLFLELCKKFNLKELFSIVAVADRKFEGGKENYSDFTCVKPTEIINYEFDFVLVTFKNAKDEIDFLEQNLEISQEKIVSVFKNEIKEEQESLEYLLNLNFDKTLPQLVKKLKNKKVMFYGACPFFEVTSKYFDISGFDVVGIADRKFNVHEDDKTFLGYKVYSPCEIKNVNPDYLIVTTKFYINIIEELYYEKLKETKIKIKPMVKKPFMTLIREIWR